MSGARADDRRALGKASYFGYGIGSLGTSIFSTVPSLLLLFFLTDTLGVPAGLAGWVVAVPKLWDMVSDPMAGTLSDRTRSRWGRRRPWLLVGALALPLVFVALFDVPAFESTALIVGWVLVFYLLAATAFTAFQVPYIAMAAELTPHSYEYTVLVSWRMVFLVIGTLVAGGLAPMLVEAGGGGRPGYALMAMVLAGICFLAMAGALLGTRRAPTLEPTRDSIPFSAHLAAAWRNRSFRVLLVSVIVQLTAVGLLLAVVPYYAHHVLKGGHQTVTLLFIALVAPAMLAMPLWARVSRGLGKLRSYRLCIGAFAALSLTLFFATPEFGRFIYLQVALIGVAYAGTQLFPFSMLPDTLLEEFAVTGVRREGVFSGLVTAGEKLGMAGGALLAGLLLQVTGFLESQAGTAVTQPESALFGIRLGASVLPAVLFALCAWLLRFHPEAARAADVVVEPA